MAERGSKPQSKDQNVNTNDKALGPPAPTINSVSSGGMHDAQKLRGSSRISTAERGSGKKGNE